MTVPLIILAILALIAGFAFFAQHFLVVPHEREEVLAVPLMALAALAAGAVLGFTMYRNRESEPLDVELLREKFYVDEFYAWLIRVTQESLARISAFIDRWIIDGIGVGGVRNTTWGFGTLLRLIQV